MTVSSVADHRWLAWAEPQPAARWRLFCFPYAGGGAAVFRSWQRELGGDVEVCPVQLPGRENRLSDKPIGDIDALAETLATALRPLLDRPYALFGYSMGALVCYRLTLALADRAERAPAWLMPCARRAPQVPAVVGRPLSELADEAFVDAVSERFQAIPPAVRAEPELMQLFLPALRADFSLFENYRHETREPLDVPICAFAGADDAGETAAVMYRWREVTRRRFALRVLPGGHFFINDNDSGLCDAVGQAMGLRKPFGDQDARARSTA